MSYFFGDGFDLYAQPTDANANYWDPASTYLNYSALGTGRFAGSRAWNWSANTTLIKTSGVNDAVHHFVLAWLQTYAPSGANYNFYIELIDGTTPQCSVCFRSDGAIVLVAGAASSSPTVLATYTGAITTQNIWYAFEIEVVIHNTNGSMTVRKNGNPNNDFYSGLLNTRASANNYANKIQMGVTSNPGSFFMDDFLWRSDASAVAWVGDIRCYTRHPQGPTDVQAQFSRTSAAVNALMWAPVGVQQNGVQTATYMQFISSYSGLLTGVTFGPNSNGGTGHIKAALFSNIGNAVGSVLAAATEVTNPPAGVTLSFPTPYYVTAGQTYWIGVITDVNTIAINVVNAPAACPAIAQSTAVAYASWPVSNPGAPLAPGVNIPGVTLIVTPQSNSDAVGELQQDLAINYVYSSTNGQADFYNIGSIPGSPAQIVGVVTRGFFEKSDAGTRNATVQLKSGTTTVQGPNTALTTAVWNWIYRTDVTDPATGLAWTVSAVNNVQIGPVVTA